MRRTKIVCTLGPSSSNEEIIEQMLKSGMNIARFNFSHGTHESHKKLIETFRSVRDRLGYPAAVMLDTKGPEIRFGNFENGCAVIKTGDEFTLTVKECVGNSEKAYVNFSKITKCVGVGDRIIADDGKISFKVTEVGDIDIKCEVTNGGEIKDHKSINIPGVLLDIPFIDEKDKADLLFGIENDVDFISASFVQSASNVIEMRKFLDYHGGHDIKIIAKIENMQGIVNFDEILAQADGIMVARGDMGVEVPFERLPGLQKRFIRKCYQSGKMVITATQMLESMLNNPTPTRAEITDVANAVFDGTSAVMLSGESAMGKYPIESVKTMALIAEQAENDAFEMDVYKDIGYEIDSRDTTNAICDATCTTARDLDVKAIIAVTMRGNTARRMSKFRPKKPIVAATPLVKTFHQLSLSWGVYPVMARFISSSDELFIHAVDCAKQIDIVKDNDKVAVTAGIPLESGVSANVLRVQIVGERR